MLLRCILAVSSSSNSTARHAHHDERYWLDTSNVSCRDVMRRAKWNLGFSLFKIFFSGRCVLSRRGSRLQIANARLNDTGTYRCVAVNTVGRSRPKRTRVVVKTVAPSCPANSRPCSDQRYCLNDGLCCQIDMLAVKLCQYDTSRSTVNLHASK